MKTLLSDESQTGNNMQNNIEKLLLYGFTEKQVKNMAILQGATAEEAEQETAAALKRISENIADTKYINNIQETCDNTQELKLFPELTEEETREKLKSLLNEMQTEAALLCYIIPAVKKIIEILTDKGEAGKNLLINAGADFCEIIAPPYNPSWSIGNIFDKIVQEKNARVMIKTELLYLKKIPDLMVLEMAKIADMATPDGQNPEETQKLFFAKLRDMIDAAQVSIKKNLIENGEIQARLYNEIKTAAANIESILNSFYDSAYFQAYNIAQTIPTTYKTAPNTYTIAELGLLYFFATSEIKPDEPQTAENAAMIGSRLKKYITKIDKYFASHPEAINGAYSAFISFIYADVTKNPQYDTSNLISAASHPSSPLNKKYRSTIANSLEEISQKDGTPQNFNKAAGARIVRLFASRYGKAQNLGYEPGDIVSIKTADIINTALGRPPKGTTSEEWENQLTPIMDTLGHIRAPVSRDNPDDEYTLLLVYGKNKKAGTTSLFSPWATERHKKIMKDTKKGKNGKNYNAWNRILTEDIIKENPLVIELIETITANMVNSAKYKKYAVNLAYLINTQCPTIAAALAEIETSSRKTQLLKRTFSSFYKYIEKKSRFYEYFLPITYTKEDGTEIITPPIFTITNTVTGEKTPYPKYKYLQDTELEIRHGGKNPKFKSRP